MSEDMMNDTRQELANATLNMDVVVALKELGGDDDPDLFRDLVVTFAEDSPDRVRAIETAARNADAEALMKAAHGLKSSAENMGVQRLSELCREVEAAGRAGELDGVDSLVLRLTREYAAAEAALKKACD